MTTDEKSARPAIEPLLDPIPTAQRLLGGISKTTVYAEVKAGRLELVKVCGRSFITRRSIKKRVADALEADGKE